MCPITICLLVYRLKQLRCSTCRREESTSMPGTSKGSVESQWCVGVGTGGPWPPKVPPLAFSHLLLRHRTQQQSGRGSEVTLCNCQELERGAGTGGRHRGWWGQNPGKSNRPREGYKLGRRPRCPGKVMREGGSGPAEGRRVLASGL